MIRLHVRTGFAMLCCVVQSVMAQENIKKPITTPNRLEIGVYSGMCLSKFTVFGYTEWNKLTPGIENGGNTYQGILNSWESRPEYKLQATLAMRSGWLEKHGITPVAGIGFTYSETINKTVNWSTESNYTIDTLISSQNGLPMYYVDTFHLEALTKHMFADRLSVSGRYMLQGNRSGRFSWLAGVELNVGASLIHEVTVDSLYRSGTSLYGTMYNTIDETYGTRVANYEATRKHIQTSNVNNVYYYGFGIPLELDFRLGTKANWLGRTVLGAEFMYGMRWTKIVNVLERRTPVFSGGLHLKYRI